MNRSRYVTRHLDEIDREIIAALNNNGRMTIRDIAEQIGLSSPSIKERILNLEDTGAIMGYTINVNPEVFGLGVVAHVRLRAIPGQVQRLAQLLRDTPEVVEADRVTGEDCFLAKAVVSDIQHLESVLDRFVPFSSTDTAIVQSSPVPRRLPKL
jgi:Lrp/AsnC family transcriptional regulator, leucine-responsive regulatory protein